MYEDALGSRAAAGRPHSLKAVAPDCTKVARARIRQVAVSYSPCLQLFTPLFVCSPVILSVQYPLKTFAE